MSFSAGIAGKYIFANKRHTALTVCSIAAAVALITVLFTIYSSYFASMLAYELSTDPWHTQLDGMTKEQAEAFVGTGGFEDYEFEEEPFTYEDVDGTVQTDIFTHLYLRFNKDTEDCDVAMETGANAAGYTYNVLNPPFPYVLNYGLLRLENIGDAAKGENIMMFAVFYVLILFIIFCSRLVIDTAFEISSKEREKQFGVLQSIGATKKQIAAIMTWEGGFISLVGIPLGVLFGLGASYLLYLGISASSAAQSLLVEGMIGDPVFSVSPLFLLIVAVTGFVWVLLSAYGTGMRAVKMSPIEAIRSRGAAVRKIKRRSVFGLIFGWTGRLASRNIRRGKKRFITTIMSVTLSMVLFVSFIYAVDIMVAAAETAYEEYTHDFEVQATNPSYDGDGSPFEHMPRKYSYRELNRLLNESGYFENILCAPAIEILADANTLPLSEELADFYNTHNTDSAFMMIRFVDEALYKRIMGDDPEVPYSQLAEQDGYVLLNAVKRQDISNYHLIKSKDVIRGLNISEGETINAGVEYFVPYDEPIVEEQEEDYGSFTYEVFGEYKTDDIGVKILGISEELSGIIDSTTFSVCLIGTYEQYDRFFRKYDDSTFIYATMDLKPDADYDQAMKHIAENIDLVKTNDQYDQRRSGRNMVAVVKMIGCTLLVLISLIAVINMVNVVSTGIINRRPEIASMRSIGMSRRQLNKMILIECLQYAVISGIAALIVSELLLYLTVGSMGLFALPEELAGIIDYSRPIGYVLIAMAAAFVCAAAAAVFPLKETERNLLLPRDV